MPDAAQQQNVLRPVIAPAAAPLERLDRVEARLPKAEHMLGEVQLFGSF
jgi:hypothetical protein